MEYTALLSVLLQELMRNSLKAGCILFLQLKVHEILAMIL